MTERREPATEAGRRLLDLRAIEYAICCDLAFEAHNETVTDHVVKSVRLWDAQLHDFVDAIEAQATDARVVALVAMVNDLLKCYDPDLDKPWPVIKQARALLSGNHRISLGSVVRSPPSTPVSRRPTDDR